MSGDIVDCLALAIEGGLENGKLDDEGVETEIFSTLGAISLGKMIECLGALASWHFNRIGGGFDGEDPGRFSRTDCE